MAPHVWLIAVVAEALSTALLLLRRCETAERTLLLGWGARHRRCREGERCPRGALRCWSRARSRHPGALWGLRPAWRHYCRCGCRTTLECAREMHGRLEVLRWRSSTSTHMWSGRPPVKSSDFCEAVRSRAWHRMAMKRSA